MSWGIGCRRGSDPALLWLWRRSVATALIRPLAWEPPYAADVALKNKQTKKNQPNKKKPPKNKPTNQELMEVGGVIHDY